MKIKRFFDIVRKLPSYCIREGIMYFRWNIMKISKNWVIWNRIPLNCRARLWRLAGCNIATKVNIGYDVYFDVTNAKHIFVEEGVWITSRVTILAHKRDLVNYCVGDDINMQPYQIRDVVIRRGAHIGMGSIIMPGVEIGEGAIIGAGAVVTKNIPAWTVACGVPCKVIRQVSVRKEGGTFEK